MCISWLWRASILNKIWSNMNLVRFQNRLQVNYKPWAGDVRPGAHPAMSIYHQQISVADYRTWHLQLDSSKINMLRTATYVCWPENEQDMS